MRTRPPVALLLLLAALACRSAAVDAVGPVASSPAAPPAPPPAVRLGFTPSAVLAHGAEGLVGELSVWAYDANDRVVGAGGMVVQVADTSVAVIASIAASRLPPDPTVVIVALRKAGRSYIRVRLGSLVDSIAFTVEPVVADDSALIVDRFAIVEWRPKCNWACPYLAYSPILEVHARPGEGIATVLSVEISFLDQPFGACTGQAAVGDAVPTGLFVINEYLWANDLIRVQLDGKPLPDGPVEARLLVRDALGRFRSMHVAGTLDRAASVETVAGLIPFSPLGC